MACVAEASGLFLPGGGIEAGEDPVRALHREVAEECARALEILSPLGSAIQLFSTPAGERYELRASFYRGRFGRSLETSPQLALCWLPASPGPPPLFHACHAWAVARALADTGA